MKKKYLALMMGLTLSLASVGTGAFAQEPASEAETAAMTEAESVEEENVEMISVEDTEQLDDEVKSEEMGESQDPEAQQKVILGEIKEVTEEGIVIAVGEEQPGILGEEKDGEAKAEEAPLSEEENTPQPGEGMVLKLTGEEETIPVTENTHIAKAAGETVILEVQTPDEDGAEDTSEQENQEAEPSQDTEGMETTENVSESAAENLEESAEEDTTESALENGAENTSDTPEDASTVSEEEPARLEEAEKQPEDMGEAKDTLILEDLKAGDLVKLTLDEEGNAETILVLENIQANEAE